MIADQLRFRLEYLAMHKYTYPHLLLTFLILAACSGGPPGASDTPRENSLAAGDYMSAALRTAVERLEAEVQEQPTNDDNVEQRLVTFWAWTNAMARRDGGLKFAPNLTTIVGRIRADREGTNYLVDDFRGRLDLESPQAARLVTNRLRAGYRELDQYVHELMLHERTPGVFGSITADTTGPFPAASYQTIRQVWHVGDRDLPPGGYLLIGRHFMSDEGTYQVDDPSGDNYISVSSSNPGVSFKPIGAPMTGMHGGFRGAVNLLAFAVDQGTLTNGDSVTITYGDTSGGSRGFRVQSVTNDAYQLPLYVSFDGNHQARYMLPLTAFKVIGAGVAGVAGFVPTVVGTGEPFKLSVRSEDRFFNKATGAMPAYRVLLDGKVVGETVGDGAIHLLDGIRIAEPGFYHFDIVSADGTIRGESNPVWVQAGPTQRIYWGETHGHGGFAEGQGSPEGYFTFARDEARLDFVSLTEHDIWLDDGEWERMRSASSDFNQEGAFVTYMGYEWTTDKFRGGHHNVIFRRRATAQRVPSQEYPILDMLYVGLRKQYRASDVLVIPHAHQTAYWNMSDPGLENLTEIHSLHGYFEWFGQAYLAAGYQVGFVAASDDHLGHPGYNSVRPSGYVDRSGLAAVWAPEKTTDAIFDGLKRRATYATTIDRIILDAAVDGVPMGGVAKASGPRNITAEVMGTSSIDTIALVKNGQPIWQQDYRRDAQLDTEQQLEILFHSSSAPVGMVPDNPRGARLWYGYLDVSGATVETVSMTHPNVHFPVTGKDAALPQRVHFATQTRGETERLLLGLKGVSASTRIELHLTEQREQPTAPATLRPPQMIPAADLEFAFAALQDGASMRELPVDEYVDAVTLKLVRDDAPRHQQIAVQDDSPPRRGDFYYVRVEQANGGMAWSSPVFVTLP